MKGVNGMNTFLKSYTDIHAETIPAKAPSFGEAQSTTDGAGKTKLRYHCSGCDQDFDIELGIEKE